MKAIPEFDLEAYSQALTKLVEQASQNVVAVQAAACRVLSGVVFREELIAVNSRALRREGKIPIDLPDGTQAHGAILGRDLAVDGLSTNCRLPIARGGAGGRMMADDG